MDGISITRYKFISYYIRRKRYLDRQQNNKWQDFRKGAEIHRRVRHKAQSSIRPGMTMIEIANLIEDSVRNYSGNDHTLKAGIGFQRGYH